MYFIKVSMKSSAWLDFKKHSVLMIAKKYHTLEYHLVNKVCVYCRLWSNFNPMSLSSVACLKIYPIPIVLIVKISSTILFTPDTLILKIELVPRTKFQENLMVSGVFLWHTVDHWVIAWWVDSTIMPAQFPHCYRNLEDFDQGWRTFRDISSSVRLPVECRWAWHNESSSQLEPLTSLW